MAIPNVGFVVTNKRLGEAYYGAIYLEGTQRSLMEMDLVAVPD